MKDGKMNTGRQTYAGQELAKEKVGRDGWTHTQDCQRVGKGKVGYRHTQERKVDVDKQTDRIGVGGKKGGWRHRGLS